MPTCLEGLKIVEFSENLHATAIGGRLLAELGAAVVKVEIGDPDPLRNRPPFFGGTDSGYTFSAVNMGKKFVYSESMNEHISALLKDADAVLVDVPLMRRKGLFEQVTQITDRQIICCVSPFGLTGPKSHYVSSDFIIQAASGIMDTTGYVGGTPMQVGVQLTEYIGGLFTVIGVLGALSYRASHDCGQTLDLSLQDTAVTYLSTFAPHVWLMGHKPTRMGGQHPIAVPWNIYKTQDGNVTICALADKMWANLISVMGMSDELGGEEYATQAGRSENRLKLDTIVAKWVAGKKTQEVVDLLESADIPVAIIQTVQTLLKDEQFIFRGMVRSVPGSGAGELVFPGSIYTLSECPGKVASFGVSIGEHNKEFGMES